MHQPILIIVNGQPGTGKTTLSHKIAKHFKLPVVNKDYIKEIIFDNLGYSDRDWSIKAGVTSYRILDYFIENQLKAGNSLIIESNFNPKFDNQRFKEWQEKYHFKTLQIMLHADGNVLIERFKKRNETGERHPGHAEQYFFDSGEIDNLKAELKPLGLSGDVVSIDTTDFSQIDYDAIYKNIDKLL